MAFARSKLRIIAAAAALAWPLAAGVALADDATPETNLFLSPAGKPYRAAKDKPYPVVDWFNAANKSHDGKLTKAEFRDDAEAFFRELDLNKDGVIDSREVQVYERIVAPEIVTAMPPDLPRPPTNDSKEQPQGGGWFGLLGEPEPVTAADRNFDGKITLAEFLKTTDERFALLDVDKRGYLTLDELPYTPLQAKLPKPKKKRH